MTGGGTMTIESIIIKVLESINKPYNFLFVGIVILILAPAEYKIYGWLSLAWSFGSFVDWIVKFIKNKIKKLEEQKRIKNEILKRKKLIINKYNKLNDKEKEIVDDCINTNNLRVNKEDYYQTLKTLEIKGFGKGLNDTFTMHEEVFDTLTEDQKLEVKS